MRAIATRLLEPIAARDFAGLESVLSPEAEMRALLPSGIVEVAGRTEIADRFRAWFGGADPFEVVSKAVGETGDRPAISYRFALRRPEALEDSIIEQHIVLIAAGETVETMHLLCSGFRPVVVSNGAVRDFDAGALGCADGLTDAFKQGIREVGVGDLLRVHTVDPAAKEDLPSLARLMGHKVQSIEAHSDGSLTVTVERGR